MFLTMESARLPCCTTFSRLSFSSFVSSPTPRRILSVSAAVLQRVVQLVGQFGRQRREIVDEVERVLDLVRDAGGELAERGQLFGLHQTVLRGAEVVQRGGKLLGARLHLVEQPHILDRDHRLVGESPAQARSRAP